MANPDTITIGADTFDVYGPRADADSYFNGKLNRSSWSSAAGSDKDRALVSATRTLDQQLWEGLPTDLVTPQALAWPRTGVTDKNDQPVGDTVFPQDLLYGYYELAQQILDNPALDEAANQDSNIKSVTADVVNVRFFRPVTGTILPTTVFNWIKQFLGSNSSSIGGFASGTDQCSEFTTRGGLLDNPYA